MAIAAGAAPLLVGHDEWFTREDQALCPARGVVLIDSDAFLRAVDQTSLCTVEEGEDEKEFGLPYTVEGVEALDMLVNVHATSSGGSGSLACVDFPLVCPSVNYDRGYDVFIRDKSDGEVLLHVVYNASTGSHGIAEAPLMGAREVFKRRKVE